MPSLWPITVVSLGNQQFTFVRLPMPSRRLVTGVELRVQGLAAADGWMDRCDLGAATDPVRRIRVVGVAVRRPASWYDSVGVPTARLRQLGYRLSCFGRGCRPVAGWLRAFPVFSLTPRMAVVGGGCCAWAFGVCPGTPGAGTPVDRRRRCGLASRSDAAAGGGRTSGPGCPVRWGRRRPSGGCGDPGS